MFFGSPSSSSHQTPAVSHCPIQLYLGHSTNALVSVKICVPVCRLLVTRQKLRNIVLKFSKKNVVATPATVFIYLFLVKIYDTKTLLCFCRFFMACPLSLNVWYLAWIMMLNVCCNKYTFLRAAHQVVSTIHSVSPLSLLSKSTSLEFTKLSDEHFL